MTDASQAEPPTQTDVLTDALDVHGPDWRSWVLSNLQRACAPLDMYGRMVAGVWSAQQAGQALDAGLALLSLPGGWRLRLPALPEADHVTLSDGQRVSVLGRFEQPVVALLDGLLSAEECTGLIEQAMQKGLRPSGVVDGHSGESVSHQARTSTSVFFTRAETPLIDRLERRLAELTDWPIENGEGLQVLRYSPGQQYKPHFDWFDADKPGSALHLRRGGQRVGTTVVYLATAEAGGGTHFPKTGVKVQPRTGGAVFFRDVDAQGRPEALSLHAGTPVEQGVKIVATYWQRERPFVGE